MQDLFRSPQEFFASQQEFFPPEPDPEPEQSPKTFYCAFSLRAFMVLLMLVIVGASLTYVVFVQTSLYTPNRRWASAMAWLFVLLFLRLTEGRWFMFTCDRFARIDNNELVLFGAFGRKRLHCQLDEALFYYTQDKQGNYRNLLVEDADARIRRFSLRLCEDPARLMEALQAINRQAYEAHLAEQEMAQLSETQQAWFKIYTQMLMTPVLALGVVQMIFGVFRSVHVLSPAWHEGMILGALVTLPLCFWRRRALRHFRLMNLPAHHHWRRNPFGNALAETLFYLKFSLLMLAIAALYSLFFTYNVGMVSLLRQPRHTAEAEVTVYGRNNTCSRSKGRNNWKLHIQVPAPYAHFSTDQCSRVSTRSDPPEAGRYTVYLRESKYARQLTFEP